MYRVLIRAVTVFAAITAVALAAARAADQPDGGNKDLRDRLADAGYQFSLTYIGEGLANVSGGMRTGAIYTGRLDLGTTIDLEKVMGWTGATFHANMFQIHGDGLSRSYIGNLMLVSGVEALSSTRLYELWIEQQLLGGKLAVRVGQQASDVEFIDSQYDDIFINSALGWPGITGINLPGGGPSPPLAVPGIRIKAALSDRITAYLALFDGSAAPPDADDSQIANANGLLFRVNDPPWWIGQLKYKFEIGESRLPATITGGGWYHMMSFPDQRFSADGLSLADPNSSGDPAWWRRNQGLFMVYEQQLARAAPGSDKGVAFFMRASVSPSDRNLISTYVDGGFLFTGFSDAHPNDRFGIAATYARISDRARAFDRDTQFFTGTPYPIRDYEAILEVTYQHEVRPGFLLQPVFQYIAHPGGGAVDPYDPTQTHRIKDGVMVGVRTTIVY
ncbi:carbohydrate porin [Bradyrhizobium sp. Arg237L]|uniref:carbohydrate porin n=1 Tax=Bradyrhizobium sp. Arg237L TaxID=3003352 RepID=UPI00249E10D7|nr:carbohydrate porin [Bradyrhizobium sp. Arg237L]MDI4239453.1 carbohydrate porin [Bradyrhizobium sp. Arg237L]